MEFVHEENRIVLLNEGKVVAEVTFPSIDEHTVDINRTFVDESMRGKGIAGKIMEETARELRERNKKVVLSCPYAARWFEKHEKLRGDNIK